MKAETNSPPSRQMARQQRPLLVQCKLTRQASRASGKLPGLALRRANRRDSRSARLRCSNLRHGTRNKGLAWLVAPPSGLQWGKWYIEYDDQSSRPSFAQSVFCYPRAVACSFTGGCLFFTVPNTRFAGRDNSCKALGYPQNISGGEHGRAVSV